MAELQIYLDSYHSKTKHFAKPVQFSFSKNQFQNVLRLNILQAKDKNKEKPKKT